MRDLGTMSESHFKALCAEVGLISNGSQIDKTGWDFLVEFPFNKLVSTDVHRSASECKVQVKATDGNKKKVQVTLSNLRRLATAQLPTFFVFMEYEKKGLPQKIYILHVDDLLIRNILKRLHEEQVNGNFHKLNKLTMMIHYGEENELKEISGAQLQERFLFHIGGDFEDYISNKSKFLHSVGYEDGAFYGSLTFDGEELSNLVDVSLGIKSDVSFRSFKGFDGRFGIMSNTPAIDVKEGRLSIPNIEPTSVGVVAFKDKKMDCGIEFDASLYTSPFKLFLPAKFFKLRVVGDFFDIVIHKEKSTFKYNFDYAVRFDLNKLKNALEFIGSLGGSGVTKYLKLSFDNFKIPLLEVNISGKDDNGFFTECIDVLECAQRIINKFKFTGSMDISIHEILSQKEIIEEFDMIINGESKSFKVSFDIVEDSLDLSIDTVCLFPIKTFIGKRAFVIILLLKGQAGKKSKIKYEVISEQVEICDKLISEYGGDISKDDVYEEMGKISESYKGTCNVVINIK